ncbi:phenylalanine--tRNA ligase subunit beta [Oleiagrimonas soli]|uniref:Phenylalanine--tRNA ligase beta subunit n=1 Tax=Oleiagrimonas soli TaxID=1543381 RepID=A0A099CYD5_9GAMM|nr:phenylalanine--tRNA ligase subunit beta [Oleiagrimonas soli]KGI78691.1 phenylalanyl-tRNA synthetase [Oleiagrimonas soli]MBB6183990.1 phenylalanyl-tRNA synthetase beta chain [Oleiagrimonas soli]
MKFSEKWLRELVDIPADRDALLRRLTMAGLEVEDVELLGESLDGVVVGEIVAAEPHPDADRLQVCTVEAGLDAPLQIVCGAPNARVGLKAPLATVGATLPGGIKIKKAKLRGVESSGMLCSAKELGVDSDASGLMELPADARTGAPFAELLGLPDAAIEIGLTPNRPDCLGMWGLARDVAAQFDSTLKIEPPSAVAIDGEASREVRLDAGADCPRYLGRIVEGIDPSAPTPLWMAERLRRAGLRPISVVVDVTNYVMLETGQPLHAFDNDRLQGAIVVRHARDGEPLTLLDGTEVTLTPEFLLIADEAAPLAVAGIMGGLASSVTDATRNVFLESAHFAPTAISGRARKLGLHTDASHRFERGVDPELPRQALERASALLRELAGGKAGPLLGAERVEDLPVREVVSLRRARLERVLGLRIEDTAVHRMLEALQCEVEDTADGWRARPPSHRFDIEREEDLIEEVIRIHGYEHIPTHAPSGELALQADPEGRLKPLDLGLQLAARGYQEAICMAFVKAELLQDWGLDADTVALANPLSADLAVMRPSLLPGLIEALRRNRARQQSRVRLFELGNVFKAGADAPVETAELALVASGAAHAEQWGQPSRAVDFHDLKGDLESVLALCADPQAWSFDAEALPHWLHPGRGARVLRDGKVAGYIGELHPRLTSALDLDAGVLVGQLHLPILQPRTLPHAQPVSRYPSVRRDLAVELSDTVSWGAVEACVRATLGARLAQLLVFDRYAGKGLGDGRKSLAMGLILQDASRTLTDEDADQCVADALAALERDCMARLRG